MKSNLNIAAALFLLIVVFLFFLNSGKTEDVCINEKCFSVEIADENDERVLGLSNRDFLEEDGGMLFVFEEETIPGFWMKDMKFSIDILWIDKDMKIIGIEKNLSPCNEECPVFYPESKVKYVLEINANISELEGFEIEDKIIIN